MVSRLLLAYLCCATWARSARGTEDAALRRFDQVTVETSKTSIYVGSVTLKLTPLLRKSGQFHATYTATVFPYFFWDESGWIAIELSDDALRQIVQGEVVQFKGRGMNDDGEERQIEGRVVPADSNSGKIKVRVFVTKKTQLIFNTTYHLAP